VIWVLHRVTELPEARLGEQAEPLLSSSRQLAE
jgi:hypothetical protein